MKLENHSFHGYRFHVLLFINHTAGCDGNSVLDSCPRNSVQYQPFCGMSPVLNTLQPVPPPWQGKSPLKMRKQLCFGNAFCLWVIKLPRRSHGKASSTCASAPSPLCKRNIGLESLAYFYSGDSHCLRGYVCGSLTLPYYQGGEVLCSQFYLPRTTTLDGCTFLVETSQRQKNYVLKKGNLLSLKNHS